MAKIINTLSTNSAINSIAEINQLFTIKNFFFSFFGLFAFTYFLFQKNLLPLPVARVVSKMLFLPTFPITALLRLNNYWTVVDDTVVLGCAPMDLLQHPKKLYALGVRGVVNLCYEYNGPIDGYKRYNIKQLYLPNVDHHEVPVADLIRAVDFINECKARGEKVYVHCKAGHGRAASVALCWLMDQNRDKDAKELNAYLKSLRKVRAKLFKQSNIIAFAAYLADKEKAKSSNKSN